MNQKISAMISMKIMAGVMANMPEAMHKMLPGIATMLSAMLSRVIPMHIGI